MIITIKKGSFFPMGMAISADKNGNERYAVALFEGKTNFEKIGQAIVRYAKDIISVDVPEITWSV